MLDFEILRKFSETDALLLQILRKILESDVSLSNIS
jgi:hypothetical protein